MSDSPASQATKLNCTQCGGELHPDEGQLFVTCPYCGATVYLDKTQVVFHWFLTPTIDQNQAASALFRWMSGSATVKDLDKKSQVVGQTFQYFPLWYFLWRSPQGDQTLMKPAAATSVTELTNLRLTAGDFKRYDDSISAQSVEPTVPLDAAREWVRQANPTFQVLESSLVHVPVYVFKYTYKNQTYTAAVEAATGSVLANIYPAKNAAPFFMAAILTALVYLCLAALPLLGLKIITVPIALVLAAIVAPFLFFLAVTVASRV